MLKKIYFLSSILAIASLCSAQETTSSAVDEVAYEAEVAPVVDTSAAEEQMDLATAIALALENNLGLQLETYNPRITAETIEIEWAAFAPQLDFSATTGESKSVLLPNNDTRTHEFTAGLRDPNTYGGSLSLETDTGRTSTNMEPYGSDLSLSYRQPILSGLGRQINLAEVRSAKSAFRQSQLSMRLAILNLLSETEIAYWRLSASYAERALRASSVKLAEALLEETTERERLGLALRVDVLQARASLASRREEMIIAARNIEAAEDDLRQLLGDTALENERSIMVRELPQIDPRLQPFREMITPTLVNDLELQIQQERIAQRKIDIAQAKDGLLPELDVIASTSLLGRDEDHFSAYRRAAGDEGHSWRVGAELSLPWGFRAEQARYRQRTQQLEQAQVRNAQIRQQLLLALREAWRNVQTGKMRTDTTLASLELNEESFQLERARYDAGAATFRDVLESQRDLDTARIRHLESTFELLRANVRLTRLNNTILQRHGFTWEEIDPLELELK